MSNLPKYWRDTIEKACRRLGHNHGNIPNAVVDRLLLPFSGRATGKSKDAWRRAMFDAALVVLSQTALTGHDKPDEKQPREKPASSRAAVKDAFYTSWEWKKVRYQVLRMHGHRCQCCGWRPGDTDHGHLVVDHIKPRKAFPKLALDVDNLQVLCNDCNMGKSNVHMDDFRKREEWFSRLQ